MNNKRYFSSISYLFLFACLLFVMLGDINGQKTVTKAARKEAMKKRKHDEIIRKAKTETSKIKERNRKETKSDKIKKLVNEHMNTAKNAKYNRQEL